MFILFISAVGLLACASSPTEASNPPINIETTATVNTSNNNNCSYPLVMLQTGPDSECSGGNIHAWPVGVDNTDCHGWTAIDNNGKLHKNSANNISCNPDGTFSFTQYAGSLTCEGGSGGVTKTYALNSCGQDIPPTLYTKAIDLTCCTYPDSPECQIGAPTVSAGTSVSIIYINGQECVDE